MFPKVAVLLDAKQNGHYVEGMNKLSAEARAQILHLLCEGNSIRAVTRLTGASKTTVTRLVVDAGRAASWYQDRVFQNLQCRRIQVDEIWGFVGAKQKNVAKAKRKDLAYGDAWLWVATDADTKLVPSWLVGGRDSDYALAFMDDLAGRLAHRVQLTSDGSRHRQILFGGFFLARGEPAGGIRQPGGSGECSLQSAH